MTPIQKLQELSETEPSNILELRIRSIEIMSMDDITCYDVGMSDLADIVARACFGVAAESVTNKMREFASKTITANVAYNTVDGATIN